MSTPNLTLPEAVESQADLYPTHNDALRILDALAAGLRSIATTAEPAVVDGQAWWIPAGATGSEWPAHVGEVAVGIGGGWVYITPPEGLTVWVADVDALKAWDGAAWADAGGGGTGGTGLKAQVWSGGGTIPTPGAGDSGTVYMVDTSAGATDIALPETTSVGAGVVFGLMKTSDDVEQLFVGTSGSDTYRGDTYIDLRARWQMILLMSDGNGHWNDITGWIPEMGLRHLTATPGASFTLGEQYDSADVRVSTATAFSLDPPSQFSSTPPKAALRRVKFTQLGGGSLTWAGDIDWGTNGPPTLGGSIDDYLLVDFYYLEDSGTGTWFASLIKQDPPAAAAGEYGSRRITSGSSYTLQDSDNNQTIFIQSLVSTFDILVDTTTYPSQPFRCRVVGKVSSGLTISVKSDPPGSALFFVPTTGNVSQVDMSTDYGYVDIERTGDQTLFHVSGTL